MCGIAGVWGADADSVRALGEMLRALSHRGPDDRGIWTGEAVALGHTRLSIIDVASGRQPLGNEDGRLQVVLNGEIYNHAELRRGLEAAGHRFRTRADTEVLVHLFEDHGPAFLPRLRGMFAFAVSDGRRLLLARDPLGVKPLYYGWSRGRLFFASEMKALARVTRRMHVFPAGHCAMLERAALPDRPLPTRPYYALPEVGRWDSVPWEQAVDEVRATLAGAVHDRLVADVPVGVLLSGGLDSTLVAALARRMRDGVLHSFATGLEGSPDLAYAEDAARRIGTTHHAAVYTAADVVRALPAVVRALESFDPALVRSAVPMWFVARLARERVKVVLTGEGADELFAGYDYLAGLAGRALDEELAAITANLHWTNLQRADRMSMAHGLEAREPFLDTRLVDLAFRLPWSFKRPATGPGKRVLRAAARSLVPEDVIARPKAKFSQGTGTAEVLRAHAESAVTDADFRRARRPDGSPFASKEELLYYRLFLEALPEEAAALVGRTRSVVPGEVTPDRDRTGSDDIHPHPAPLRG